VLLESSQKGPCGETYGPPQDVNWVIALSVGVASASGVALVAIAFFVIRNRKRTMHLKRVHSDQTITM